jgi:hypothetical protein
MVIGALSFDRSASMRAAWQEPASNFNGGETVELRKAIMGQIQGVVFLSQ